MRPRYNRCRRSWLINIIFPAIVAELARKNSVIKKGAIKILSIMKPEYLSQKTEKHIRAEYEILYDKEEVRNK